MSGNENRWKYKMTFSLKQLVLIALALQTEYEDVQDSEVRRNLNSLQRSIDKQIGIGNRKRLKNGKS